MRAVSYPKSIFAILLWGLAAFATNAQAQTVADITKRGKIIIGIVAGMPLYSNPDASGNYAGYDVDVAKLVAKYMGVEAELVPLTPPARIPSLQSAKVDVLVATLAPTPERAKTVMFTMPYNVFQLAVMAPKSAAIKGIADLKGKTVAFNKGTSQQAYAQKLRDQGTKVVYFEDDALTAQALVSRQVDAVALPDLVEIEVAKNNPQAELEVKYVFYQQPNSMTVRKDAFELKQWLNNFIYFIKVSGELNAISEKWLGQPLPTLPVF
jgi:polar amino acid transport system substrate-binding protein